MAEIKKMSRHSITWDGLKRLHKINNHLAAAASGIEYLCLNIIDIGVISEELQKRTGVTIWKLREICDELYKIEEKEKAWAEIWQQYLDGKRESLPNESER